MTATDPYDTARQQLQQAITRFLASERNSADVHQPGRTHATTYGNFSEDVQGLRPRHNCKVGYDSTGSLSWSVLVGSGEVVINEDGSWLMGKTTPGGVMVLADANSQPVHMAPDAFSHVVSVVTAVLADYTAVWFDTTPPTPTAIIHPQAMPQLQRAKGWPWTLICASATALLTWCSAWLGMVLLIVGCIVAVLEFNKYKSAHTPMPTLTKVGLGVLCLAFFSVGVSCVYVLIEALNAGVAP